MGNRTAASVDREYLSDVWGGVRDFAAQDRDNEVLLGWLVAAQTAGRGGDDSFTLASLLLDAVEMCAEDTGSTVDHTLLRLHERVFWDRQLDPKGAVGTKD
ncbi:MAG: hypothetical protein LC640_04930 [Frankia sp.]|nr:hypothetical protein [Frankia sp.]